MIPVAVEFENFRCFEGRHRIPFPDGLTSVQGEILDAPVGVTSNGSGKSSLLLAVDVALFGPEGKSLAEYVTHGCDWLELCLEFEHEGETYRVRRSFSRKGNGKSTCDFERMEAQA